MTGCGIPRWLIEWRQRGRKPQATRPGEAPLAAILEAMAASPRPDPRVVARAALVGVGHARLALDGDPASVDRLPDRLPDGRRLLAHPCDGIAYPLALLTLGIVQAVWLPPTPAPRFWVWELLSMAAGLRHLDEAAHGWGRDQDLTQTRPPVWAGGLVAATPEIRGQLRKALPNEAAAQDSSRRTTSRHR